LIEAARRVRLRLSRYSEGFADMASLSNSRIAWFNGSYVPEREVMIPFRDRSWKYGDGAFDMTRTFDGRPFKLREHIDRFYRSLRYLKIDPGVSANDMIEISEEVAKRNEHLRAGAGDWWIGQRVSRGVDAVGDEGWEHTGPNVVVECLPLPLKARAKTVRDGLDVIVPAIRRVAPSSLSPRAKTHNYLNTIMADMEAKARDPNAWSILLDENGNLAEGIGSNVFLVRDGELYTPQARYVLAGVSRGTVIELAKELKIPVHECDLDLFDAANADEIFLTSTSLCIVPVRNFDGRVVGSISGTNAYPGPVTKKITQAYIDLVGCDFVAQYLAHV
jgi:branched-chain amino acid aminotransferase